jgi:hypothetical protein
MGGAYSKHGRNEKCIKHFGSETCRERDHSEDLCIDKKIILEWILGKYGVGMWSGCIWLR